MKAMSLTDADIASMSNQSCAAMDQKSQIAPANDRYTTRLNEVVKAMPVSVNGVTANYKVYLIKNVNACAMAKAAFVCTAA